MSERGVEKPDWSDEIASEKPRRSLKKRVFVAFAFSTTAILIVTFVMVVNAAREAGREAQCSFRLMEIGQGLQAYHTGFGSFPYAALPNDRLPPEKRLSWQLMLIPYVGFCPHCWGLDELCKVDRSKGWDSGNQAQFATLPLEPLLCPSSRVSLPYGTYSGMHGFDWTKLTEKVPAVYIGISGLGRNAAFLKKGDPNAGIFGYNRVTRHNDIKDGEANTMMVAETSLLVAPWTAGGEATVRGLDPTRMPYIPQQFGGNHPGTVMVSFADGSVRRIRATIHPKVFEGISTISGGEKLPSGWQD